ELVITCFAGIRDDPEAQCVNLRRLAEIGMAGIILYYVGVVMPKVDQKLIETADEFDFPLICMPPNIKNLRYSEVITEVMEAIFNDQQRETNYQAEILERISRLPVYQRSIDTAMRMLSDRLRVSLLLSDTSGNLLNSVYWPRNLALESEKTITRFMEDPAADITENKIHIIRTVVHTASNYRLDLYILKQDEYVKPDDARQITDILRICINLLSEKHGEQALPELVQTILRNEPVRMRRIARVFNIDVASIHTMWILTTEQADYGNSRRLLSMIREELSPYCRTIAADIHNQDVVAFTDDPVGGDIFLIAGDVSKTVRKAGINALITVCFNLQDTARVRRAYLQAKNALAAVRQIYPRKRVFSQHEAAFAESCQQIIAQGETEVKERTAILDCLVPDDDRQSGDLRSTAAVFLLDADGSLEKCAELLLLHRNTIKYRLQHINERLGFKIGHMPETMEVYTAIALERILDKK
ncbi:MAG: PucR family transcriptional regulator ligand-binding domain-containing protein, partial [Treponema sp.]|nr:PucR family transcriptional regulator ligand-binding domain-containing protein [Treponema sp.]